MLRGSLALHVDSGRRENRSPLTTGSKIQRCPTIPVQVTFELSVLGARLTHVVKHLAGGPPAHRETIKESRVVGDTANVGRMIH